MPLAPENTGVVLDRARGVFPHTRESTAGLGSFTRQRIERIISIVVGLGSLAIGAQAFLAALDSSEELPGWRIALMILVFIPLTVMIVACGIGRGVSIFAAVFVFCYLVALLLWPLATAGVPIDPASAPWIWFLVNIATVASILAFSLSWQVVFTIAIPLLFGVVRLIQGGFTGAFWVSVGLDVSFAIMLGGIVVVIVRVFRKAAAEVDQSRSRAVESYARAASSDAAEQERIAVAALMHDSVLAALIAAERASTPRERTLAVAMAREALTRLANTEQDSEEGSDELREPESIADDIERSARELGAQLVVEREVDPATPLVPGRVARALVLAATQAISNAIQHADGAGLMVTVRGESSPAQVEITVRDEGPGFDLDAIPRDRLGIRASIFARVAAVGGTSVVESDQSGTTIHLEWAGMPA